MKLYLAIITEPSCPVNQTPVVKTFPSSKARNNFFVQEQLRMIRNGKGGLQTTMYTDNGVIQSLYCDFGDGRVLERIDAAESELKTISLSV